MVDFVIWVAEKVGEYLVAPVGRQLGYLVHYNSNIAELQGEAKKLSNKRLRLQLRVEEADRKGDEILPDVRNWLTSTENISREVENFIEDEKKAKKCCFFKGLCPNLISRYQLSRHAKKKALDVKKSLEGGDFPTISYRRPLPGAGSAAPQGYEAFESRNQALEKIMEWLRCDDVKKIGVCGMGGVGKTTLVKQVANQANQEKLFSTEIYIDVSWTRDSEKYDGTAKIQQQIAEMLGFQFQGKDEATRAVELEQRLRPKDKEVEQKDKEVEHHFLEKDEATRAVELKQRLRPKDKEVEQKDKEVEQKDKEVEEAKSKDKEVEEAESKDKEVEKEKELKKIKILIILDDIWKEINLEKVGIPFNDQTKCKVVLASRNEDLLRKGMDAKKCFRIQHLQEKEAWRLFKKTAGDYVEGDELQPIAFKVVQECGGLPIAIVTIAKALKDESVAVWKNALHELETSTPTSIWGVEEKVYACLEWSYKHLKNDEVKSLFLLCGSLSYGDISMDHLLRYAMGLDSFNHIKSLELARNKLVTLVRTLKSSSLLLSHDGYSFEGEASRLLFTDDDNKNVMMHDIVRDVARNIASKDPQRFAVQEDVLLEDWSETDECKRCTFMSLNCAVVHELPQKLVCPKLQFFLLHNNNPLLNIPNTIFEGMNQIKVLDLSGMAFTTLPSSLQSLTNLRTLCLDRTYKLRDIVVIGELKQLQVLSMAGSNIQQLPREIVHLTNLRLLNLNDCNKALQEIPPNILSGLSRLECLRMISSFTQWVAEGVSGGESNASLSELNHLRYLTMIEVEIPYEELVPKEDKFFENLTNFAIFIGKFQWLEKKYERSKTLRLNSVDGSLLLRDGIGKLLKKTEELQLRELEVCRGPILRSLDSLKFLKVRECHELKILFLVSMARGLPQLEEMIIESCYDMQQIMAYEREIEIMEDDHVGINLQLFPKLLSLKLHCLPELMDFGSFSSELETTSRGMYSQGNLRIDMPLFSTQVLFSNLGILQLYYLPKLREIWHHQLPLHSFSNLLTLRVEYCPCLLNLIPCHLMRSLKNLKEIVVENCEVVEHVFDLQGHDTNVEILPKLETLKLKNLVGLKGICNNGKNDSTKGFFSSFMPVSFDNLKCLSIDNCGKEDKDQENVNIPVEDGVLFGGKVLFSNLGILQLYNLPKLREIWHHQLPLHSFSNLLTLNVEDCPYLLNLIPCHLMQSLKNLKEIVVKNCEVIEHVFDLQGHDTNVEILPKLETLKLKNLVGLKGICNNGKNDSTKGFFSSFLPVSFDNLKCLSIDNCGKEDKDQENVNIPVEDGVLFGGKVSLPNLEVLELSDLFMLKMIWHSQLSLEFFEDKLEILNVHTCPRLVNLIPSHLMQSFQNLKEVVVRDCKVLESVFDHRGFNGDNRILPKLEILQLEELPKLSFIVYNKDQNDNIRHLLSPFKFKDFCHLKELRIINCGKPLDEKVSLSHNLEVLVLESFSKLKEIDFEIPPRLKFLTLNKLPKLSSIICKEDEIVGQRCLLSPSMFKNFHNLEQLRINDCGMMEYWVVLSNEKVPFLDGVCNDEAFESRASTLNKIMDVLRDDNINSIGVVGIGGVGKTTLVKQVAHQAMQEKLFTTQVYFDLSWTRDSDKLGQKVISHMQEKLACMFGWILKPWYLNESKRAVELKQGLKKEKVLIILDNIWKEIDLEEVGIPSCKDDGEKECKIVLSSRDGELLSKGMGAQICFPVETLPPKEAWALFKKTASGGDFDNWVVEDINNPEERSSIAIQVAEECEGLPLAIVTIAKALKDETQLAIWKNALEQLRNCAAGKKVYSCLEWSYTHLKLEDVKSLLLLCGMLGGGDIPLDLLLQYCMGLDCFDRMKSLEHARNKLLTWVEILKPSGLLLDSHEYRENFDEDSSLLFMDSKNKSVQMHDVVSGVARRIASMDLHRPFVVREDVGLEEWSETDESRRFTFISLHCKAVNYQLPQGLVCPELQFFRLQNNDNPSLNIHIPITFFQGMKNLKVLDLSGSGFSTLPSALDSLENLRTLRLCWCCNLVDIALIGKLKKLEVLSLEGSAIQQLPDEMVQLSNLRLLDLNNCRQLKVVPQKVLSNLSRLECLFMSCSFTKWAMEGDESNACLSELNHLSCLTTLYIQIADAELLPKDIQFEKLTRYVILVGHLQGSKTDRALRLNKINRSLHLRNGISRLLERSKELEFLKLSGTKFVLHPLDRESFLELKHLRVNDSPEIQYIIDSKDQRFMQLGAFPLLESLVLEDMENLEEVWHGQIPTGSFGSLKTLNVFSCSKLRYLLLLSMAEGLSQLEILSIISCKTMQQIIAYERESKVKEDEYAMTNLQLFPNLRKLTLRNLPRLINFFSHKVLFSKLEVLEFHGVPKLKNVWYHQGPFGSSSSQILHVCPNVNADHSYHPQFSFYPYD